MTDRDFKALIASVRELAATTESAAYDLAPSISPNDTAQLIATVAHLNRMIDRIEQSDPMEGAPHSAMRAPPNSYLN